jgi:DNA-directed RNA polymerase specialized sigma24 family protein
MDAFEEAGQSAAEAVAGREQLREIVGDVHALPETQRTALILREFDALSYQQIAETMETTVPAVKSLLVRARIGLASAAEARTVEAAAAIAAAA